MSVDERHIKTAANLSTSSLVAADFAGEFGKNLPPLLFFKAPVPVALPTCMCVAVSTVLLGGGSKASLSL